MPATTIARRGPLARVALVAVGFLAVALLLRALVAEPLQVSSESMSPTLERGDAVLVDKLGPRVGRLHRSDLVAFRAPDDGRLALKRVVGLAGDRVAIRDAILFVDDRPVPEPYVDHTRIDSVYYGPVTVPAGHVLVMGDNRGNSVDSRAYGPVAAERIEGRVLIRLWPPHR
jgi:signal peptidase I